MPKQTFINLPVEKKKKLIAAGKKEFSRVPLQEAVISNIVKDANIPRGSFYQYFDDLEDLFFYILQEHMQWNRQRFLRLLEVHRGDLIETFIGVFTSMLADFQQAENRVFFKNAFLNMNHRVSNAFTEQTSLEKSGGREALFGLIDKEKLNIKDEQELRHALRIIQAVTFQTLIHSFAAQLQADEATALYEAEMVLLKKGLYR